jgi:diadenylate cyclase
MNKFWLAMAVILAIIFQTEIRYGLATLGSKIKIFLFFGNKDIKIDFLKEIVEAVFEMSKIRMGALIVIERDFSLKTYTDQATIIDALVSHELLLSIFNTKAPIHDGAIIIKNGRIKAASCVLPISTEIEVKHLGTRHRAAIGLSSLTDAIVVVVSEETGKISVVADGKIKEYTNNNKLLEKLKEYCTVLDEKDEKDEKNKLKKLISKIKKIKLKDIRKAIMLNWTFKVLSFFLALFFWLYITLL